MAFFRLQDLFQQALVPALHDFNHAFIEQDGIFLETYGQRQDIVPPLYVFRRTLTRALFRKNIL